MRVKCKPGKLSITGDKFIFIIIITTVIQHPGSEDAWAVCSLPLSSCFHNGQEGEPQKRLPLGFDCRAGCGKGAVLPSLSLLTDGLHQPKGASRAQIYAVESSSPGQIPSLLQGVFDQQDVIYPSCCGKDLQFSHSRKAVPTSLVMQLWLTQTHNPYFPATGRCLESPQNLGAHHHSPMWGWDVLARQWEGDKEGAIVSCNQSLRGQD